MKYFFTLLLLIIVLPLSAQQGVGINTANLDDGSALQIDSATGSLVIPRMTTEQMNNIPTPLNGAIIYNISTNNWYIYINDEWRAYTYNDTASVILNKNGGSLQMQSNPPIPLPLNSSNVLATVSDYYVIESEENPSGNSTITVLRDGAYLVTAGLSTTNLPAGSRKYKVMVYVNGELRSYLTTGNVDLSHSDYWGTSGNSILILRQNDVVQIKYTLDGTNTINAKFFNIGMSKL